MAGRAFRQAGFTLVELLTVIALMTILMSLSTLFFSQMQKKSNIEKEVRTIYTTLMTVRLEALYQKTARSVKVSGSRLDIFATESVVGAPVSSVALAYPVLTNGGATRLTFDSSGMLTGAYDSSGNLVNAEMAICVAPSGSLADNEGNVDSVDAGPAKIYMGKRVSGGACVPGPAAIIQK